MALPPTQSVFVNYSENETALNAKQLTDEVEAANVDLYNEDKAEIKYLLAKPVCFVVLGKPGCGKTTIAKKLAEHWKTEIINGVSVIQEQISKKTPIGRQLQETLASGNAVSEETVMDLIKNKIGSPEVAHRGYVLDDIPSPTNRLDISPVEQLNYFNSLPIAPQFILYIRVADVDLIERRINQKADPVAGTLYVKRAYDPPPPPEKPVVEKKEGEDEEEEVEEEEAPEDPREAAAKMEFPPVPPEIVKRLVIRPEDLEQNVEMLIRMFRENALQAVEDYVAGHQQPHVLELDGNQPPNTVFNQLLLFLKCHPICPAVIPQRFFKVRRERVAVEEEEKEQGEEGGEEEEPVLQEDEFEEEEEEEGGAIAEDADADEVLRALSSRKRPSPRFRWRRSKWLLSCPVKLRTGELYKSPPINAVQFLDKVYVLSTIDTANQFIANPRPYLLPPQPRPPCKFVITGLTLSGKSTLAELLARRYGATVIDVKKIMAPKLEEERVRLVAEMQTQTLVAAIDRVRSLRMESLAQKRAASLVRRVAEEAGAAGETEIETTKPLGGLEPIGETEENVDGQPALIDTEKTEAEDTTPEVTVSETDPEVIALVNQTMAEFNKREITLPAASWVEACREAVKQAEERNSARLGFKSSGSWILDGFPHNKDQWQELGGSDTFPDQILYLRDGSERYQELVKRWFVTNRSNVIAQIRQRITREAEARRAALETERRRKYEEDVQRQQEMAALAAAAAGTGGGEANASTGGDQDAGLVEPVPELEELPPIEESDTDLMAFEKFVIESADNHDLIIDYAEIEAFRKELSDFETEWNATVIPLLRQVVPPTSPYAADPIVISIEAHPSSEQLLEAAFKQLEAPFRYVGWEFGPADAEEEDVDAEADQEEEEAEEEGEGEEERSTESKRFFGETAEFCPVQLVEREILSPGNPDIAAKYRERVYYFSNEEAREKFLANPLNYVPQNGPPKPPPLRICLIGPKGSGKTLQGRQIAQKLNMFYVNFRERMQEMMLAKLGKRVGPEQKDQEEWTDLVKKDADVTKIINELQRAPETAEGNETAESRADDTETATRPGAETSTGGESSAAAEQEEPQLNEIEQSIRDNLEMTEPTTLPTNVLETILTDFWTKEPLKSAGFIMEGFPRTEAEMRWLADSGLFPDCVVFLSVNSGDIVSRLLPGRMDAWLKRREKQKAQRTLIAEARKKQRLVMMAKRREQLLEERATARANEKAEREARKLANEDEEEEEAEEEEQPEEEEDFAMLDASEVDAALAEEFPEEEGEEEEEQETEVDAKDRLESEIAEMCEAEKSSQEIIRDVLQEIRVPSLEIDASRKPHIVRYTLTKRMRQFIEWRPSIFERPTSVKAEVAEKLLATGYKRLSRFGRWCPVKLAEGDCLPPNWDPPAPVFPAVYRSYVYYFSSQDARKQFQHEPLRFVADSVPDPPPVVPIRLAIVGPPKSGKSTLATRFAEKFNVIRLSAGEAMRWLLANEAHTELAINIDAFLRRGKTVPDELVVAAIELAILGQTGCRTRGYVLDGWPATRAQAELLTAARITPFRIIELFVSSEEVMTRGLRDRTSRDRTIILHDSAQVLALRLAAHRQQMPLIKQWYEVEHPGSFGRIDGFANRWAIWEHTLQSVRESIVAVQRYLARALVGKAAPIFGLCIRPAELLDKLSEYGHYCPVALAHAELINCVEDLAMINSAEYAGFYYRCASKENLEEFLAHPEHFVPPLAPYPLPPEHLLPKRLPADKTDNLPLAMGGYCAVTFGDGKLRYEALVTGTKQFAVEYNHKLYLFANEDRLKKFMKTPVPYADLTLPHKLPPPREPLPLEALPALGYLEQTTANALVKALTAAGCRKPKLPFCSPARSALLYVALHLKAFNPNLPPTHYSRQKYKRLLDEFDKACGLTESLAKHITVNYKEPSLRFPKDFDSQMEKFFSLKDTPPVY